MRRFWLVTFGTMILAATALPAKAEYPLERFWRRFWQTAHANNRWPWPYVLPDREAVRAPFRQMVANGWKAQSTLNSHYFEENGELSAAGKERLLDILTHVPPEHRQIRVERHTDPQITSARIQSVEKLAGQLAVNGEVPPITVTNERAHGWPALEVDHSRRKFIESIPEPRLPEKQNFTDAN